MKWIATYAPNKKVAIAAVVFASTVGFMGIGLVDPILVSISKGLNASPSQVSLLFTSYFLITAIMMLVTDYVATRIGLKNTIMAGAIIVAIFSMCSGMSQTVYQLVGFRSGWGLGNALFVATALSLIVTLSKSESKKSIRLYETALGVGIAVGPLLGAALGSHSWRYPFWGTSFLMFIGCIAIAAFVTKTPVVRSERSSLMEPIRALKHKQLRQISIAAFFYNFVFFSILAYAPFVLNLDVMTVGGIFFLWGIALAFTSTILTPRWQARLRPIQILSRSLIALVLLMLFIAFFAQPSHFNVKILILAIIISGGLFGIVNTIFTELAIETTTVKTSISSAAYNFVRWLGGAIAPLLITKLGESQGAQWSFVLAAVFALFSYLVITRTHPPKPKISHPIQTTPSSTHQTLQVVMVLVDGSTADDLVIHYAENNLTPSKHMIILFGIEVIEGVEGVGIREKIELSYVKEYCDGLSKKGFEVKSEIISDVLPLQISTTIIEREQALKAELLLMSDLILMFKHTEGAFLNMLSFSVTQELTENCGCPLLIIPSHETV